jgi:hypothetical protein
MRIVLTKFLPMIFMDAMRCVASQFSRHVMARLRVSNNSFTRYVRGSRVQSLPW